MKIVFIRNTTLEDVRLINYVVVGFEVELPAIHLFGAALRADRRKCASYNYLPKYVCLRRIQRICVGAGLSCARTGDLARRFRCPAVSILHLDRGPGIQ